MRALWLLWSIFSACVCPVSAQILEQGPVPGPDSRETGQGPHGHLFGNWGGERTRLLEHGVRFDFQYVADHLSNVTGEKSERFVSWNRVRGTVDIDFGALIGQRNLY
ncbi:MAG TPA: hypothetical protein VNW46_15280, partial [Gemmatimonadaceae bacterium]|nr:hypothetical protein [Gemmatimonadaceae bacterium]